VAEKYNRLEDGMQQALDDIQRGKSPDLRFTLEKQLEKEETKAKNQDLLDMLEQARARSREEERER
jgi:tartrate dehydratase alpha subunit/fumarate hydratase class I-like protein